MLLDDNFAFDLEGLMMDAGTTRAAFESGKPFQHVVIDDFLKPDALAESAASFPRPDSNVWSVQDWVIHGQPVSRKKSCNEELQMPVPIRRIMRELNCSLFLRYLNQLTGIPLLVADPTSFGNSIFLIEPGGFLNVHADYSHHFEAGIEHRLNLLLYLSQDWREEYGGSLEFWEPGVGAPTKSILPNANRCIIFSVTSQSYHGHPKPLTCPPGRTRNCLAVSYYTIAKPGAPTTEPHETIWTPNPYLR
jgi:2OG-Fe(II) oxygenase superfamily